MNTAVASKTELTRTSNDRRRRLFLGCQVMVTPSVQELSNDKKAQLCIRRAIVQFIKTYGTI